MSRDEAGLRAAFRAQAMIDRRGLDGARECRVGEQQQGQAVRPAGDGDAQPRRAGPDQRFEIGAEAINKGGRGRHRTRLAKD